MRLWPCSRRCAPLWRPSRTGPSARVVDALLSTIQGPDVMSGIVQAARDSAQKAADTARRTSYETACAEAQAAYASP